MKIKKKYCNLLTNILTGVGAVQLFSPLDMIVDPIANFIIGLTQETGWIVLIIAFGLLYFSLKTLVKVLKAILDEDLQEKVKKYLFGSWWQAMLFGLAITIALQSSSITTSLIVPIIALGVVTAIQSLPYFLGANIGTSTTALLAALSLARDGGIEGTASLMVALVHMVFDLYAIALLFPFKKIREIPVWLAERSAKWVTKGRIIAIAYIAIVFYLLPFAGVWASRDWEVATFYQPVVPEEVEALRNKSDASSTGGENPKEPAPNSSQ
ncbi:MAG: Na/Pi symporter [Spirirestis rafaelensis WJT71-NPBG6]|jgi:sodium-dependent phosphate cotransporter|nr:Na/Pi symporter [Spirirestis rafaelensis WJT71-NPBG6]